MSRAGWWNVDSLTLGHDWSVRHRFAPGATDRTLCGVSEIWGRSRPEGVGPQCARCMYGPYETPAQALPELAPIVWDPKPTPSRLSEAIRNARLRGDRVVHLDEIESPDRGVLIAFEGRWIWAEYRDGKLRDSATRAPASSVLAFADYAQWREAFGR